MTVADQVRAEELLSERLNGFQGQWVAVRDHTVVESAPTISELMERLDGTEVEAVFEVPAEAGITCFF